MTLLHGMPAGQAVSRFGSAIFFFSSSLSQIDKLINALK